MDFWNLDRIKEALGECKCYSFENNWSASGLKIWHEDLSERDIIVVRLDGDTRGVLKKNIPRVINNTSAFITNNHQELKSYDKPIIEVPDTDLAIVRAGEYKRKLYRGKVIAITGSAGKSTTTKLIYEGLSDCGVSSNLNQANTLHGICWNMASFDINSKYWVIETSIGRGAVTIPDIAVITNVAPVHLTTNQTIVDIAKAKCRIFDTMSEGSTAVIFRETECYELFENAAKAKGLKIITVGESTDCNIMVNTEEKSAFTINNKTYPFADYVIPKHLLIDMGLALAVINELDESIDYALVKMRNFKALNGRGETFKGVIETPKDKKNIVIVDESYNANPLSMKLTLEAFGKMYKDKRRVLILGDMTEGGANAHEQHLEIEETIRKIKPERIYMCGEQIYPLWEKLKNDFKGEYFKDAATLNNSLVKILQNDDCIFIKSSHSVGLHKTTALIKQLINI